MQKRNFFGLNQKKKQRNKYIEDLDEDDDEYLIDQDKDNGI